MPSKTFCDPNDFDTFLSSTNGGAMDGVPGCEVDGDTDGDMDGVISQDPNLQDSISRTILFIHDLFMIYFKF
jgi:hypothetical protein